MPPGATFRSWAARVPDGFLFAVKASRYLTHVRRLRDPRPSVGLLVERATELGSHLGPILIQLPPDLEIDLKALEQTLDAFPAGLRLVVEPRHSSWFTDDLRRSLTDRGVALCLADRRGPIRPIWRTADWTYVRFHAGRGTPRSCYEANELAAWAARLETAGAEKPPPSCTSTTTEAAVPSATRASSPRFWIGAASPLRACHESPTPSWSPRRLRRGSRRSCSRRRGRIVGPNRRLIETPGPAGSTARNAPASRRGRSRAEKQTSSADALAPARRRASPTDRVQGGIVPADHVPGDGADRLRRISCHHRGETSHGRHHDARGRPRQGEEAPQGARVDDRARRQDAGGAVRHDQGRADGPRGHRGGDLLSRAEEPPQGQGHRPRGVRGAPRRRPPDGRAREPRRLATRPGAPRRS